MEGVVCLVMALPVALPFALLGGAVGGRVAERDRGGLLVGLLLLPAAAGLEATQPRGGALHEVLSTIEIDAPADRVWTNVIAFPPLAEPTEWWRRTGLAYPRYASIEGNGASEPSATASSPPVRSSSRSRRGNQASASRSTWWTRRRPCGS